MVSVAKTRGGASLKQLSASVLTGGLGPVTATMGVSQGLDPWAPLMAGFIYLLGAYATGTSRSWGPCFAAGITAPFVLETLLRVYHMALGSPLGWRWLVLGLANATVFILAVGTTRPRPHSDAAARAGPLSVAGSAAAMMSFTVALSNPLLISAGDLVYLHVDYRGWWAPLAAGLALLAFVHLHHWVGRITAAGLLLGLGVLYWPAVGLHEPMPQARALYLALGAAGAVAALVSPARKRSISRDRRDE